MKIRIFNNKGEDVTDKEEYYIDTFGYVNVMTNDIDNPMEIAVGYTFKIMGDDNGEK